MSTGDGFRFFAKYYEANKTDKTDDVDNTTVGHVARREKKFFAKYYEANKTDDDDNTTVGHVARRKKKYLYIQSCVA